MCWIYEIIFSLKLQSIGLKKLYKDKFIQLNIESSTKIYFSNFIYHNFHDLR